MNAATHTLSGVYAVDALGGSERTDFERHMTGCTECSAEVRELRETVAHLAVLSTVSPPPALKASVLSATQDVRPLPPLLESSDDPASVEEPTKRKVISLDAARTRRRGPLQWVTGAVAAAVIAIGLVVWAPWQQPTDDTPPPTAAEQIMQAPDAQTYPLAIEGDVKLVRSESLGKSVLIAKGMSAAPTGQDYQLWYMSSGAFVSAGVMSEDEIGDISVMLDGDAATATAFGITLEPDGGSPSPSDNIVALVNF